MMAIWLMAISIMTIRRTGATNVSQTNYNNHNNHYKEMERQEKEREMIDEWIRRAEQN